MLEAITQKVDRSAVRHPNGEKVARSFADRPWPYSTNKRRGSEFDIMERYLREEFMKPKNTFWALQNVLKQK